MQIGTGNEQGASELSEAMSVPKQHAEEPVVVRRSSQ